MPLVPARLPVLQPLHVRQHLGRADRVDGVLREQRPQLERRRVLELLHPRGQQVVDRLGGLLRAAAEERLQHQHAVAQLALVTDLTLIGEQVVTQVHGVGEGVAQHPHRPRGRDPGRHLGRHRVLDQPGRPGGAADLAPHLDVLDRVGHPAPVDVGQLPQRLVEQVASALREPRPPVGGHARHRTRPQVGQPGFHRTGRLGHRQVQAHRHEGGQPVEIPLAALEVTRALEDLQEVIVEEEDPHVPVGDQTQLGAVAVGMGVGAHQRIVVGVEVGLLPDARALEHAHVARPLRGVRAGLVEVRVEPGRIRLVEVRQFERLGHHRSFT